MPISQNLIFNGKSIEENKIDEQKGLSIMVYLQKELNKLEYKTSEIDNWRDSGWQMYCNILNNELEITLASIENDVWYLQIAPKYKPGIIGKLLGKLTSATPKETFKLAEVINNILRNKGTFNNFKWLWDRFPQKPYSTDNPVMV